MARTLRHIARSLRAHLHTLGRAGTAIRDESGQAIVELALAVPILLIVIFGIVDFAKAVNYWNDETHIANLTARYVAVGRLPESGTCASTNPPTAATVTAFAECQAGVDSPALKSGSGEPTGTQGALKVCVSIPVEQIGQPVEVKVTSEYSWLPLPKVLGGKTKFATTPISGQATMRLENTPPAGLATTNSRCP
jgi:Flp pilus assembly protein TadG